MRRKISHIVFLLTILVSISSLGQISPGDLSNSHANLEGMSKCTLCHDLGEKVSNAKCLDCHKEIQSLLNQNKGYHANASIVNKDCFECHSDHHGRKFDMVRFDEKKFDHDVTGYTLEGKHEEIDCRKCHIPDNIANTEIRKRKNTFLGLDQDCLACHDDFHQKTLSNDCMSCHNMDAFVPAAKFDHDLSEYPLQGKHLEVDCKECHKVTSKNGVKFQEFSDLSFSDCVACHTDPHNNQIKGNCMQCHTESSFTTFVGTRNFNHNVTEFELKGEHNRVDCFSCHKKTSNPLSVFQDVFTMDENACVACHDDVHENKFGSDCAKCHNEKSFLTLNNMDFFDHTVTDYPLEGKHLEVDCKECHQERFSAPIDFLSCSNCHSDYHQGEFKAKNIDSDCVECNSLEFGFEYSLYTIEQHQTTSYPLEGAHIATPCYACHISEDDERWTFVNLGSDCIDCHTDIHEDYISKSYYPDNSCTSCHINEAWDIVSFDHELTNWPLEGRHSETKCQQCHMDFSENKTLVSQTFSNLDNQCAACHDNVHDDLFAIDGITDCNRCHVSDSWLPEKFDHNRTAFKLEGVHAEIDCKACHEVSDSNEIKSVVYKLNKLECIDCHL